MMIQMNYMEYQKNFIIKNKVTDINKWMHEKASDDNDGI